MLGEAHRGQSGQTLVVALLTMAALLGMLALVVDVGMAYYQRRSLQNAVDAAALAGSSELPSDPVLAEDKALPVGRRQQHH